MQDEKTIQELIREQKRFLVPCYQRGYRWKRVNVLDLLNDLDEFIRSDKDVYSLQPLVIFDSKDDGYHIVDGQQRLTTISILLNYLGQQQIPITYETRKDTQRNYYVAYDTEEKMKEQGVESSLKYFNNIDQYHVNQAYKAIEQWFGGAIEKKKEFIELLTDQTSKRVKFIWYCTTDDEVVTFIRMNKGKIALTNAELIKALLLKKGNFGGDSELLQKSIAAEWHNMEELFNDDAFWSFIRPQNDDRPTRMDYLFEIVSTKNLLNFEPKNDVGNDKYATFRYFYQYFKEKKAKAFQEIWDKINRLYNIFVHWYNEIEIYHYVGFLVIDNPICVLTLLDRWMQDGMTIDGFKAGLKKDINEVISRSGCNQLSRQYKCNEDANPDKTKCVPILLLFNIQRIILLNRSLSSKTDTQIFHKFPFHLYKQEKWNVEHIASATDNDLSKPEYRKAWLKTFLFDPMIEDDTKKAIVESMNQPNDPAFEALHRRLVKEEKMWDESEKNQIWNFCLLDEHTNKSYGNAIFPVKRRIVLGKELGKKYELDDRLTVIAKPNAVAFVPGCTKDVFAKAFSMHDTSNREWTKEDAEDYKQAIFDCLKEDFNVSL